MRVYLFDVIVWNNKSDLRLSLSKQIYSHHQKCMPHFAFVWLLCTENLLNQYFTAWKCLQGQHLFSQKFEIIDQLFISINVCALLLFVFSFHSVSLFQEMWPFGLFWNRHLWIAKHDAKLFFWSSNFWLILHFFVDCDIHYRWTFAHDGLSYNYGVYNKAACSFNLLWCDAFRQMCNLETGCV